MSNAIDIYGYIGAAKAFNSSVRYSLKLDSESNNNNADKKNKRLKKRNKMNNSQSKTDNSSTDFLSKICDYLDIGIETVIKWIAKVIVGFLPALEVSVKMLLLTNIKKMVSCAIDPRIPDEWRYPGILLNEAMIDPRNILKSSPYSKWGKYNYFGVVSYDKNDENEENDEEKTPKTDPTFGLARAEDMNAFLWFAKNCAKFVSPNILGGDLSEYFDGATSATTLYNTHVFKGKKNHRYTEGSTFKHSQNSNTTFLCEKKELRDNGTYYTIVPATDRWTGITWYKDRTSITGVDGRKETNKKKEINYNKSKPLFNIEYIGDYNKALLYPDGNFRFRILPKPFSTAGGFVIDLLNNVNTMLDVVNGAATEVIGSKIETNLPEYKYQGIQSPIPYYARFNEKGIYDKSGRYSIDTLRYYVVEDVSTNTPSSENIYFEIINKTTETQVEPETAIAYLKFNKKSKTFFLVSDKTNDEELNIETLSSILTECYAGNTVYEFNYDYIVSLKLFDAQEIAIGIVDALMNVNIPNPFKKSHNISNNNDSISNTDQVRIDAYVDKLVEKMINTEDGEFTDCFYSFSNKDYEAMEQEVADKIINSTLVNDNGSESINEIYDIIDSYNTDATLNEKVETISLALTKAANACGFTDGGEGNAINQQYIDNSSRFASVSGDKSSIQNFINQAIKFLTSSIVNAMLTPKVLMLMQVNRMMMGTYAMPVRQKLSVEDLLNGLSDLLKGVIREIVNTIQKELLRLILERLSEMTASFIKKLGLEYAMKWVLLLKQLLSCFKQSKNNMNGSGLYGNQYASTINNIIDDVDYADINTLIDEIIPNTNPC